MKYLLMIVGLLSSDTIPDIGAYELGTEKWVPYSDCSLYERQIQLLEQKITAMEEREMILWYIGYMQGSRNDEKDTLRFYLRLVRDSIRTEKREIPGYRP